MALVAATTLGCTYFATVRAEVWGRGVAGRSHEGGGYRLVVQSYDLRSMAPDGLPAEHARPLGSTQRVVTAEELERGLSVDVLQVGGDERGGEDAVVVAWVEAGAPDLEFDALTARPGPGAVFGTGRQVRGAANGRARVVLEQRWGGA